MKLTLTYDDGTIIARWDVAEDFGDVTRPIPKQLMAQEIGDAVERASTPQAALLKPGKP